MKQPLVVDADLVAHPLVQACAGRVVVERRRAGGRRSDGRERRRQHASRLTSRAGRLVWIRPCLVCGGEHDSPFVAGAPLRSQRPREACSALRVRSTQLPAHARDRVVWWALLFLWLFNLEDLLLTKGALDRGARETNVVMGWLLSQGLLPAVAFKMGIVSLGVWLLWRYRRYPAALTGSVALAAVYLLVIVYQVTLGAAL